MIKRFFVCLAATLFFLNTSVYAVFFHRDLKIEALICDYLPNVHVGVAVADARTGQQLYHYHGVENFTPASNIKLFTAAAALLELRAGYRYQTVFAYQPSRLKNHVLEGNVYVQFTGDPSLTDVDLKQMTAQLKQDGIEKITGNIIFDDSWFQPPNYLSGMTFEDLNWYYSAPVSAVIVNENRVQLYLQPGSTVSKPSLVIPKLGMQFVTMENHVHTVPYDQAMHHCHLLLNVDQKNHINLGGCWPVYGVRSELNIAVKNPVLFASNILAVYMNQNGIQFHGIFKKGRMPKAHLKTIIHYSAPLKQLLKKLLKKSDNLYATALTKTLGVVYYNVGTIQEGVNAVKKILHDAYGLSFENTELIDGVGSQYNLLSPEKVVELLYHVKHDNVNYPDFLNALPSSNSPENSTFASVTSFKHLPKNVYAKTGRLHTGSALSGYMETRQSRELIFSFMMDDMRQFRRAQELQTKLCEYFSTIF
jgi:D-alanyl-D-alanine carboxypeptidase/D-alanyl-D-alanine-endopeptidase (penicillin-binding protein 4)